MAGGISTKLNILVYCDSEAERKLSTSPVLTKPHFNSRKFMAKINFQFKCDILWPKGDSWRQAVVIFLKYLELRTKH